MQIVRRDNFLGVVAPYEYDAIQAAAQLKVQWADPPTLPGDGNLYGAMRTTALTKDTIVLNIGDVGQGFASAAKIVSSTYEFPYQMHGPIGPQCCVADVTSTDATVFGHTQGAYDIQALIASALNMPVSKVRMIVVQGSSTYGRDAGEDEAPMFAAIMSQIVGKPVRMQLMRWDNQGWDNFGPADVADIRGGLDANGKIVAYDYTSYGSSTPTYSTGDQYAPNIPNRRLRGKTIAQFMRTGPLRGPGHVQPGWASEQMMDELAHAANMDPLAFRRAHTTDPYWRGVLDGVAQLANWQPKVAASNLSNANIVSGRGISLSTESHPGSLVYDAVVADIEVNKKTGKIAVKHLYGVQDSGLAVNPALIENQLSGMLMQGTSRALLERVSFTKTRVSSLDWASYPTLRFKDAPKVTTSVTQRLDDIYRGAGESMVVPTVSAIGNAFFDATGVRIRRAPMSPAAVRAALKAAGVA